MPVQWHLWDHFTRQLQVSIFSDLSAGHRHHQLCQCPLLEASDSWENGLKIFATLGQATWQGCDRKSPAIVPEQRTRLKQVKRPLSLLFEVGKVTLIRVSFAGPVKQELPEQA